MPTSKFEFGHCGYRSWNLLTTPLNPFLNPLDSDHAIFFSSNAPLPLSAVLSMLLPLPTVRLCVLGTVHLSAQVVQSKHVVLILGPALLFVTQLKNRTSIGDQFRLTSEVRHATTRVIEIVDHDRGCFHRGSGI